MHVLAIDNMNTYDVIVYIHVYFRRTAKLIQAAIDDQPDRIIALCQAGINVNDIACNATVSVGIRELARTGL